MGKVKKTLKQLHREKNKIYVRKEAKCKSKCKTKRKKSIKDWRQTIKPKLKSKINKVPNMMISDEQLEKDFKEEYMKLCSVECMKKKGGGKTEEKKIYTDWNKCWEKVDAKRSPWKKFTLGKDNRREFIKTHKKELDAHDKLYKKTFKKCDKIRRDQRKKGGGKTKMTTSEFKEFLQGKEREGWKEVRKCNKTCSKIKTNYAKNKKKLKQQRECYGTCDKERLINIRKVHKQFSKEFKQFIKNM